MPPEDVPDSNLTYDQVADRIEQALGERPATVTLRAEVSRPRSAARRHRDSLTAGLPSPVTPSGQPPRFSAHQIETWLASHPRKKQRRLVEMLTKSTEPDLDQLIQQARNEGLSWAAIADMLSDVTGRRYSRQAVQQRYARTVADSS